MCAGMAGFLPTTGTQLLADDAADVKRQVELLPQQNVWLQEQVRQHHEPGSVLVRHARLSAINMPQPASPTQSAAR